MERVKETRLKDLLRQGIAYLHEGMHEADQVTVQALFESGAIQVRCWLVGPSAWEGVPSPAHVDVLKAA